MERDEQFEPCARCGAVLDDEAREGERCPSCGALVAAASGAPPFLPDPYGVPVARFYPASAGPPVAPEPYLPVDPSLDPSLDAPDDMAPVFARPPRPSARLRIMLPQPQPRRGSWLSLTLTAVLTLSLGALVIAGLLAGTFARADGAGHWLGLPPSGNAEPTDPAPTATPVCLVQPIFAAAATALTQATLTTGLRNPATQDFRPVDSVRTFQAGQTAYVTFQIATTQAGTAGVAFCTSAGQIPGTLDVPAHSNGHYAQFSLPLDATGTGTGVVTLTWNGAVAASLPFTIEAPGDTSAGA